VGGRGVGVAVGMKTQPLRRCKLTFCAVRRAALKMMILFVLAMAFLIRFAPMLWFL
jgi:hypothetical protein